ncbi:MAG: transglycosylase SLT domain-containing protein [Candidatus Gastranaerophilaceae bacterium]
MYVFKKDNNLWYKIVIILLCLVFGLFFAKIYQPISKTYKIYESALKDYDNENYSNAYYLFSKISYSSNLKPIAIFRQAMCAKVLGDKNSELKAYMQLFRTYPKFKLSSEARYLAAQLLIDDNPQLAYKYFNQVTKSDIDEDFKIASEYYKARIDASKIRYSNKIFSRKKVADVEKAYRKYLQTYPDGRLAPSVAANWQKFNPNMKSKDIVLVAKAYYFAENYKESNTILKKAKKEDSWAVAASNSLALFDYTKTKNLTEEGVAKFANSVEKGDYKRAVDDYLSMFELKDRYINVSKLFSIAKGNGKDYLWKLKCDNSLQKDQAACYRELYSNYPESEYAQDVLLQIFLAEILQKKYASARQTARNFMTKYPESSYSPLVMFWAGKIEQKYNNFELAAKYFNDIINKYPDSYYAYRAYWLIKNVESSVISANLDYKPVIYPYKYPNKTDILYSLMQVKDYDMLIKFTNDEFIKSWVEYERGNYAKSMVIARDAMAEITLKPVKTDLRWRLVYPQNYYKQVKNFSNIYKNNDALMMAIIREESSFNPQVQSSVGAIGLMQLMPTTAHDIGSKHGIEFNTSSLVNPELNIKLGNLYYSTIRGMLENKDVSAIAAYNGGIGAVSNWKANLKYNDTDEFVEQIPYDETKNYVKKVFKSYWNYTRIYQNR